jgi:hypothetical protein
MIFRKSLSIKQIELKNKQVMNVTTLFFIANSTFNLVENIRNKTHTNI